VIVKEEIIIVIRGRKRNFKQIKLKFGFLHVTA